MIPDILPPEGSMRTNRFPKTFRATSKVGCKKKLR
jgi:hypothetical protein